MPNHTLNPREPQQKPSPSSMTWEEYCAACLRERFKARRDNLELSHDHLIAHAHRDAIQACVFLVSMRFGDKAGEWLLQMTQQQLNGVPAEQAQ